MKIFKTSTARDEIYSFMFYVVVLSVSLYSNDTRYRLSAWRYKDSLPFTLIAYFLLCHVYLCCLTVYKNSCNCKFWCICY